MVMICNDGSATNEEVFWNFFVGLCGEQVRNHLLVFEDFYRNEFNQTREGCGFTQQSVGAIHAVATLGRMGWAGLDEADFLRVTTCENSHYCKQTPPVIRKFRMRWA